MRGPSHSECLATRKRKGPWLVLIRRRRQCIFARLLLPPERQGGARARRIDDISQAKTRWDSQPASAGRQTSPTSPYFGFLPLYAESWFAS